MMIVEPNSRSLTLSATHILAVRVESSQAGPWTPRKPDGEERNVSLSLKLEEVVKGPVKQRQGNSIKLGVKQVRRRFTLGPLPGIWSNVSVDPGTHLVAFGRTGRDDAADALDEPGCTRLVPAAEALEDVHVAATAETQHLDLGGLLARAKSVAPSLGWLFADYLWARHEAEVLSDIRKFDQIADLIELPNLGFVARTTLVMTITTAVEAPEPPPTKHIDRLAVSLFRLLAMPEAARLHDNLVGTYLPNLVGLNGGVEPRHAGNIFRDYAPDRARAEQALRAYKGDEPTAPLLDWLKR